MTLYLFIFHLERFFPSQDIQMFIFLSYLFFCPFDHCFSGWSKINLKVYDIINCLNENLIINFVWYFEKVKVMDITNLSIDRRTLNKQNFYEKIMQKISTQASPKPF